MAALLAVGCSSTESATTTAEATTTTEAATTTASPPVQRWTAAS
jgi:uncharacterized protein YceK